MKKLYLLSGMIVLSITVNVNTSEVKKNPGNLKEERRQKIESVQLGKAERQRELERKPVYKMVDAYITENPELGHTVNWQGVFHLLDSMKGVISVNEYRTFNWNVPLIWIAVYQKNINAAKMLLEKYHANPNILQKDLDLEGSPIIEPSMSPLMSACKQKNTTMVTLLLNHRADPYLQNEDNENAFFYAQNNSEILKLLNQYKK